ncbi:hypothetical protein [Neobacillus mesonae]|uniref:hypothetical protein n=1 Tax=Neobacillus mesonae TaxID=1193713 RepID=UPI00082C57A8|nr:hypothetical protein [Neobacillus mesonae]
MSRKIFIMIIVVGVIVFALYAYLKPSLPRSFHHRFTESTDLHNESINNLQLYENINGDRFKQAYAKGISKKSRNHEKYDYYKIQNGVEIGTNKAGYILRFIIENSKTASKKGVKPGDPIAKVRKAYGDHYYTRIEQGLVIIGYIDKKSHQSIEFWHDKKRVIFFRLDDQSME